MRSAAYRCAALAGVFLAFGTTANAQTITVVNDAHVTPLTLFKVEHAIEVQSQQVAAAWGSPTVQFGRDGWPLTLRRSSIAWGYHSDHLTYLGDWACADGGCVGAPGATLQRTPYLAVYVGRDPQHSESWSETFSHEIIETIVDPNLGGPEICDPVEQYGYRLDGEYVSDFALPAYFNSGAPLDEMGALS